MVKTTTKETNDESSTDSENERDRNDDAKVTPKCPHIIKSIDFTKVKKYIKQNGFSSHCADCEKEKKEPPKSEDAVDEEEEEYDRSLWMCLRCGLQFCGRTVNKHAIAHYSVSYLIIQEITIFYFILKTFCFS